MTKKFPLILISIFLVSFFIIPAHISAQEAQDSYWPLKEKEIENLLDIIRKEPLTKANRGLFDKSLYYAYSDYPRKTGAVVLVKQGILQEQLDYWFKTVPIQLSIKFIKTVLKLVPLIYSGGDIATVIETIEKFTVEKANDCALQWFLENEIKIGSGEASYTYPSYKGNTQQIKIQYIIVYHPINKIQGKIVTEFYSKNLIEPPLGTDPWRCPDAIFDHPKTICWTWDRWLENERKRDNDGKLEPFIVRVKGNVRKNRWGDFEWDETKSLPIVEVDFDNPVPEIDQSDVILETGATEAKWNLFKERVIKPLAEAAMATKDFMANTGKKAKEVSTNLIEIITDYISSQWFGAKITGPGREEIDLTELDTETLEKLTQEALTLEETEEIAEDEVIQEEKEETKPSLEELAERFDDISEDVEILLAQVEQFFSENTPPPTEEASEEEKIEEKKTEEEEEEEEKREGEMPEEISERDVCRVNINTASLKELQKITGVGPVIAQRIIEERPFYSLSDLIRVKGIGSVTLEKIVAQGCAYVEGAYFGYVSYGGGGGATTPTEETSEQSSPPPKILITEIQIKTATSSNYDFVELYNPITSSLDISGFQLKKRTSGGKEYSVRVFPSGSSISPEDYFLWANSEYASSTQIPADVTSTQTLAGNNSLGLFDREGNVIDQVAWGSSTNPFVETAPFPENPEETQTLGRKFDNQDNNYLDTDDNSQDFELQFPTPKEKNQTYQAPPTLPEPAESPPQPSELAKSVIISEVKTRDEEFLELYNPKIEVTSTLGWYLCYFSQNKQWSEPKTCWEFPTSTLIEANKYYLIGISNYPTSTESGYPEADWTILGKTTGKAYSTGQLSNTNGAIGIFSCLPKIATTSTTTLEEAIAQAQACKIDLVGWGNLKVKEGNPASASEGENKSLTRRKNKDGYYIDNDDNFVDFEIKYPTPTNSKGETGNILPPARIEDFQVASSTNNTITLTWSIATDPDTPTSSISYIVYWSKTAGITTSTLTAPSTQITTTTLATTTLTLTNLYYDSTYYFGIRAFDGLWYSELTTTSPYVIPLPKITDLNAGPSAIREAIDLFWTSSAQQWFIPKKGWQIATATSYEIRYSFEPITEDNWQNAVSVENSIVPRGQEEIEHFVVRNLDPEKLYYFAIKSIGKNGTVSKISNIAKTKPIPGFRDNGDGTITDLYTGLMWIKDGESTSSFNGATTTQGNAILFAKQLSFAGYDDWRLPNFKELATIVNYEKSNPAIDENYFINIKPDKYWSSTFRQVAGGAFAGPRRYKAFYLNFNNGELKPVWYDAGRSPGYYLLAVRGPEIPDGSNQENFNLKDNADGTKTDLRTNLVWPNYNFTQDYAAGIGEYIYDFRKRWKQAIRFAGNRVLCQDGTFQGNISEPGDCSEHQGIKYDNWRLPNILEILGVVGCNAILKTTNCYYWSSTQDSLSGENYWAAGNGTYSLGETTPTGKEGSLCLQIVRDNF